MSSSPSISPIPWSQLARQRSRSARHWLIVKIPTTIPTDPRSTPLVFPPMRVVPRHPQRGPGLPECLVGGSTPPSVQQMHLLKEALNWLNVVRLCPTSLFVDVSVIFVNERTRVIFAITTSVYWRWILDISYLMNSTLDKT